MPDLMFKDNSRKKQFFLFTPLCVKDDSIKNILSTKSCCSLRAISLNDFGIDDIYKTMHLLA